MTDASQTLYRQIKNGGNPIYYEPNRTPILHSAAFLPSSQDKDGLSVIQGGFRTKIWAAYRPEQPEERFRIALLRFDFLKTIALDAGFPDLQLKTTPDQLDDYFGIPFAHGVLPEINRISYDNCLVSKKQIKEFGKKSG